MNESHMLAHSSSVGDLAFDLFRARLSELLYGESQCHTAKSPNDTARQLQYFTSLWAATHGAAKDLWKAEATGAFSDTFKAYETDCDFLTPFKLWKDSKVWQELRASWGSAEERAEYDVTMRKRWDEHIFKEVKAYWAAKLWDLRRDAFSREMAKKLLTERTASTSTSIHEFTTRVDLGATSTPAPLYRDPYNADVSMDYQGTSGYTYQPLPRTNPQTQDSPMRDTQPRALLRIFNGDPQPEKPFGSDWNTFNAAAPSTQAFATPQTPSVATGSESGADWECPVPACLFIFRDSVALMGHLEDHRVERPYAFVSGSQGF